MSSSIVRGATAGFSPSKLADAGLIVAGGVANAYVSGQLTGLIPIGFLQTKPGYYIPGLVSAGLLGAVTGMVMPRYAPQVFTGGLVQVVLKAVHDYLPSVQALGDFFTTGTRLKPFSGMADFYSRQSPVQPMMTGFDGDVLQEAVYGGDLY